MAEREPPISFKRIDVALTDAMSSDAMPLGQNGGNARTIFDLTSANLRARASILGLGVQDVDRAYGRAAEAFEKGVKLCESPIECMALAALINADWPGFETIPPIVHEAKKEAFLPLGDVILVPQFAFVKYRIDIAVICNVDKRRHIMAVECDGGEFHDPEKDRKRDFYLMSWGIPTFRLTGKDINYDVTKAVSPAVFHMADWRKSLNDSVLEKAA